jgi:head-tail adaptor
VTQPGNLNRRLVLQAPDETADGAGGVVRGYANVALLWAQVTPQAMRADVAAASRGAVQRFRILIRRRNDVTTRHRFADGAAIYCVIAARLSADWRFLEIDAEVRED